MDVDVFIGGAGPIGLLLACQLQRIGLSTFLTEKTTQADQAKYGGAAAITPRSLELLDQLELADPLLQHGFVCKGTATFKDGQLLQRGGWDFVSKISDTTFDHILHLRQMYTQRTLLDALEKYGGCVHQGIRLQDLIFDDRESRYRITLMDADGKESQVNARFVIGADGGKSLVRKLANIKFVGYSTPLRWVRLDAVVETSMPKPYSRIGPVSIETQSHGNVLWAPMDHGRTRIGFPFTSRMQEKYGDSVTQADIELEAVEALRPFELQFRTADWWTIYSVGHRLAEKYFVSPNLNSSTPPSHLKTCGIFLAGDAAHTYSSGTAQGMNAGIHDATNLAWKLAGVIRGWYDPSILKTYEQERRPAAASIIQLDKSISSCISGEIPEAWEGEETDAAEIFSKLLDLNAQQTVGLGVHYQVDHLLNKPTMSVGDVVPAELQQAPNLTPGHRAPDVWLSKPGTLDPIRLYKIMQNTGRFWILVFASTISSKYHHLREYRASRAFNFVTIIPGQAPSVDDALGGVEPFGTAYFDVDGQAHNRYGLRGVEDGGTVVVRPDGIVGYTCPLEEPSLNSYFDKFMLKSSGQ
ncbi:MAG: hypothetical protein L6R40_007306 [Gallowayella cf. fulva]|nr:MAG: hypothetical protein L6R40_007306 [Xanthomendoza cf. fulva]